MIVRIMMKEEEVDNDMDYISLIVILGLLIIKAVVLVGVLVSVLAVGVLVVFWRCFGGILVFIEDIVMDIMVVVFFLFVI